MSDERTIVINDLLSFISCKIKLYPRNDLIKCISDFYSKEDIDGALKTYLKALPPEQQQIYKLQSARRLGDSLLLLYDLLKQPQGENSPIFVCKDLNNIPKVEPGDTSDCNDSSHTDLLNEQKHIKSQISEIVAVVYQLKDQIQLLSQTKKKNFFKKEKKGLAYLQKLIDEEDENFEEAALNEESEEEICIIEKDEDTDICIEEEQTLHSKANRMQKSFIENAEKMNVNKKVGQNTQDSDFELERCERLSTQKVIHISHNEFESPSKLHDADIESSSKVTVVDSIFQGDDLDEIMEGKCKYPYIDIEQVFDENIGHFSIYKCSLCSFSTNDSSAIDQHDCPQIYSEPTSKAAGDAATNSCQYFCLDCRFKCNSKMLYERHSQVHPQLFPCPFCDEKSLGSDNWTQHVKACVINNNVKRSNHICQVCSIIYANSGALLVHKGFHDPAKPYECLKCRYRFYTEDTLNRHFKAHVIKGFKCPFCHFTNKNKTTLGTHIRCHTGEMPYACDYCGYRSSSQSALTSHLLCHTDKKTVQCDECHALFKSLHKLNAHKVSHLKNRIHKCPVCRKGFKTGWLMTIHHQRIHLNVRPYGCKHCSYRARSLSALKNHFSTHSNEKLFKCSQCDFKANLKSYLKRHVDLLHPDTAKEFKDDVVEADDMSI